MNGHDKIFAVDPGTEKTAWVVMLRDGTIAEHGITPNHQMFDVLDRALNVHCVTHMAIEMIASMGMAVGQSVFETAVWIGQMVRHWTYRGDTTYELVYRADEKLHLCGSPRAKDANIRQAIIDAYSVDADGGAREAVGNKRNPGPLYGVSKDVWSAIAVAKVAFETTPEERVNKRSNL